MVIMIRLMIPSRHPPRSMMMMMRAMKLKRWRWKMVIMIICWPLTSGVDHDFSGDVDFLLATLPGQWWWWGRWCWKDEDNDLINGDQGDYDYPGVNNDVSDEVMLIITSTIGTKTKDSFLASIDNCAWLLELGTLSHFVALVCHVLLYTFVTFCCTHLSHIVVLGCHTCLSRSVVLVCHTCVGLLYLEQGGSRHFGAIVAIGKLRLVTTKSRFSLDLQSDKK